MTNLYLASMQGSVAGQSFCTSPYEKQKEILKEASQLLDLCVELEKKIEKRDSYQERIMQAVVKQAFA